jgi:hypothetical protein
VFIGMLFPHVGEPWRTGLGLLFLGSVGVVMWLAHRRVEVAGEGGHG